MAAMFKLSLLLVLVSLTWAGAQKNLKPYNIVNPFICTPGSTYNLDCNMCRCSRNGVGECTLMACNLRPDQCIPGSVFQIRDQLCKCPDCGYKWHSDCFESNYCANYNVRLSHNNGMSSVP